uniref:Uncharacterized protein n=1 Tax=Heterorhabditis bacteriophora TaxID=37862 RepID=A0A1I7WJ75_HETBA
MEKRADTDPAIAHAIQSFTVTNEQDTSNRDTVNQRLMTNCANGEFRTEVRLDPMLVVKVCSLSFASYLPSFCNGFVGSILVLHLCHYSRSFDNGNGARYIDQY